MNQFNKHTITQGLKGVAFRLKAQMAHGEIYLVGSAAVAMAYNDSRASVDVDARIDKEHSKVINAVRETGRRNG